MMSVKGLLEKTGLDKKQQVLLIRIIATSVTVCFLIITGAGVLQSIGAKKKPHVAAQVPFHGKDEDAGKKTGSATLLPIDIAAHEWMAQYFLRTDQPQEAIEHLLRIFPIKQRDRAFNLTLATAHMNALRYTDAMEILELLADQETTDSLSDSIDARLGLTLYYLGKTAESMARLEHCLKKYPDSHEAPCYLGEVKGAVNAASVEAEEYLNLAITREKGYTEARYQLARLFMARGEYEKARTSLLQVLALEPLNVRAHSRLGMTYYYLNQPAFALQSYQTALALNPGDFNTHYNLGELYHTTGNMNDALDEYKKTLVSQPAHVEAHFKIGLICLSNNMIKEAVQHFENARDNSRHNTRILLQLGVSYERLALKKEAVDVYKSILIYDELNPVALQKLRLLEKAPLKIDTEKPKRDHLEKPVTTKTDDAHQEKSSHH